MTITTPKTPSECCSECYNRGASWVKAVAFVDEHVGHLCLACLVATVIVVFGDQP